MKTITVFLLLTIAGCSASFEAEPAESRHAIEVCENPAGVYVIRSGADPTDAYRTRDLIDRLHFGATGIMAPRCAPNCQAPAVNSCPSKEACLAGGCVGWTCSAMGALVSPDDGRVGGRTDDTAQFDTTGELLDPVNVNLDEFEKLELIALRASAQVFENFECWEE